MPNYEYQRMAVDKPDVWERIELDELKIILAGYYKDVDAVLVSLCSGSRIRTSFAFYRWVRTD
jgi:hypothetical protein